MLNNRSINSDRSVLSLAEGWQATGDQVADAGRAAALDVLKLLTGSSTSVYPPNF
ncbi:hypothetical protein [Micromonospora gifhornensis]|uniref:hypothetical protein n=1 Tax=Micromonospora gifhornensis TaxID=84594 RepID=UPI001952F598|nr:hypothetical protein [Micromonospora gifhornensis]